MKENKTLITIAAAGYWRQKIAGCVWQAATLRVVPEDKAHGREERFEVGQDSLCGMV